MKEYQWLGENQLKLIKETIKEQEKVEKLLEYLNRNEIVGKEVFPYVNFTDEKFDYSVMYYPISRDKFIKRIPFFAYKPNLNKNSIGDFRLYYLGIYKMESMDDNFEDITERIYETIEKMYYHYELDLDTIFNYPIKQTGYGSDLDIFFKWAHYLELAEKLKLSNRTPKHFIVDYNIALERSGLEPVIYYIEETFNNEYIERYGNTITVHGTFPCDENNQPILRWIGIKIENCTNIKLGIDKRLSGRMIIEINPKTAIWRLDCDGKENWHLLYAGPLLQTFDYKKLKETRLSQKLTQKMVAKAIDASERTYQKWEAGDTMPDCIYLLRLMNVLDIREISELTTIKL